MHIIITWRTWWRGKKTKNSVKVPLSVFDLIGLGSGPYADSFKEYLQIIPLYSQVENQ